MTTATDDINDRFDRLQRTVIAVGVGIIGTLVAGFLGIIGAMVTLILRLT